MRRFIDEDTYEGVLSMKNNLASIRIFVGREHFTVSFMLEFLKQAAFFEPVRYETDRGNRFKEFKFSESKLWILAAES